MTPEQKKRLEKVRKKRNPRSYRRSGNLALEQVDEEFLLSLLDVEAARADAAEKKNATAGRVIDQINKDTEKVCDERDDALARLKRAQDCDDKLVSRARALILSKDDIRAKLVEARAALAEAQAEVKQLREALREVLNHLHVYNNSEAPLNKRNSIASAQSALNAALEQPHD